MAILAATILPQFSNSTGDAKAGTARFNLQSLRSQIELYKAQHNGALPSQTLVELTSSTTVSGATGTGSGFPYGPYLKTLPVNPYNGQSTVVAAGGNPPTATAASGGWLYDTGSGNIWINDATTTFSAQ
jgi:type II secretory pathway pseudopilin PulG